MATQAKPHWDADSPELRRNLGKVSANIRDDAERRVIPTVATAKAWQKAIVTGLDVPQPLCAGHFRGESGLERCGAGVRDGAKVYPGANPRDVADELKTFEAKLQAAVARLDAKYPDDDSRSWVLTPRQKVKTRKAGEPEPVERVVSGLQPVVRALP